jgi:hypothetical protein
MRGKSSDRPCTGGHSSWLLMRYGLAEKATIGKKTVRPARALPTQATGRQYIRDLRAAYSDF